jgi:hypothetical protein
MSGNLNGQLKQVLFRPMTRFPKQGAAMKQRKACVAPASNATAQRIRQGGDNLSGSGRRPAQGWACLFTPGPQLRWNRTAKNETTAAAN